jgi:tRNA A37 N6-isopentenylltransferase MiaA
MPLEEAVEEVKKNTRRLAKGQRTWFKTFRDVRWIEAEADAPPEAIFEQAATLVRT